MVGLDFIKAMLYSCIVLFILFSSALAETIEITVSGGSFYDPYYTFSGLPAQFVKGNTYTFKMSGISSMHPFSVGSGYKLAGGLSGSGYSATSGKYDDTSFEITIPTDFSGTKLKYFCTRHYDMQKDFGIDVVAAETPAPAPSNAKCNAQVCNEFPGLVLKENYTSIDCIHPTCDAEHDIENCCEPGYSFGLADINLCPDDSPVNIVWAGEHNIQESVSHDCLSAKISGPLEFDGSHTHTSGDEQFLYAGSRKPVAANLLSDWDSTRYFRCSQHCGGARLRVTCDRAKPLGYCAADYAALERVYDPDVPECPHGAAPIRQNDTLPSSLNGYKYMCRCGKCGEIFESMVKIREACVDGVLTAVPGCNDVPPQPATSCADCADGLYFVPLASLCTGCHQNGSAITPALAKDMHPPVELCPSTPEVSAASCDTFTCPSGWVDKANKTSLTCEGATCKQRGTSSDEYGYGTEGWGQGEPMLDLHRCCDYGNSEFAYVEHSKKNDGSWMSAAQGGSGCLSDKCYEKSHSSEYGAHGYNVCNWGSGTCAACAYCQNRPASCTTFDCSTETGWVDKANKASLTCAGATCKQRGASPGEYGYGTEGWGQGQPMLDLHRCCDYGNSEFAYVEHSKENDGSWMSAAQGGSGCLSDKCYEKSHSSEYGAHGYNVCNWLSGTCAACAYCQDKATFKEMTSDKTCGCVATCLSSLRSRNNDYETVCGWNGCEGCEFCDGHGRDCSVSETSIVATQKDPTNGRCGCDSVKCPRSLVRRDNDYVTVCGWSGCEGCEFCVGYGRVCSESETPIVATDREMTSDRRCGCSADKCKNHLDRKGYDTVCGWNGCEGCEFCEGHGRDCSESETPIVATDRDMTSDRRCGCSAETCKRHLDRKGYDTVCGWNGCEGCEFCEGHGRDCSESETSIVANDREMTSDRRCGCSADKCPSALARTNNDYVTVCGWNGCEGCEFCVGYGRDCSESETPIVATDRDMTSDRRCGCSAETCIRHLDRKGYDTVCGWNGCEGCEFCQVESRTDKDCSESETPIVATFREMTSDRRCGCSPETCIRHLDRKGYDTVCGWNGCEGCEFCNSYSEC